MKTIFYLENRGNQYIYHFLVYVLGGLYLIENEIYNIRGPKNTSGLLINNNIVKVPSNKVIIPYIIYIPDLSQWQIEAFELLAPKFILINELPSEKYEIISIYGILSTKLDLQSLLYTRQLFNKVITYPTIQKKYVYISRKQSACFHNNVLKRHVLNEDALIIMLNKYNFSIVILEDLQFSEKIKLFQQSNIILSTMGSQGTLMLFANDDCKYIEICKKGTSGFPNNQIQQLCSVINRQYNRYNKINEDKMGNFTLDISLFEKYLNAFIV
jgi:capsular polysaccharide biosynthesis protein